MWLTECSYPLRWVNNLVCRQTQATQSLMHPHHTQAAAAVGAVRGGAQAGCCMAQLRLQLPCCWRCCSSSVGGWGFPNLNECYCSCTSAVVCCVCSALLLPPCYVCDTFPVVLAGVMVLLAQHMWSLLCYP